jgi:predicted  nucleic acid-binding Zn-ribbon protein
MSDIHNPEPVHLDFMQYLDYAREDLTHELAETHQTLARLAVDIAFVKGEEERGQQHAKALRRQMEGTREAYTEKKWLLKALIDGK